MAFNFWEPDIIVFFYGREDIVEAIAIEESGQKVVFKKNHEPIPEVLTLVFSEDAKIKKAFYALTPGRQRVYTLHFSSAKQSITRHARIVKYIPLILAGKGISDR